MLRIDGLHGKQVLIMTGHLSCFGNSGDLTKRFVDNLSVDFYTDGAIGLPKEYVIEYYVGQEVPNLPMMSIMLSVIPTIHSTMLPTGKKLNISKLQDNYLQVKQNHFTLIRLKLMLFVCV